MTARSDGAPRRTPLARTTPLKRTSGPQRRPSLIASAEQREKVAGGACLVCGRRGCDPAHLVARATGGCNDADCVVALCRPHHRAFDRGELDLLPDLEPGHRLELAHAVGHVGLVATLRRLTGRRDAARSPSAPSATRRTVARMPPPDRVPLDQPLLTLAEIAEAFGIPTGAAYRYTRRQDDPLPCVKLGRRLRFARPEVERWLARQRGARS